MSTTPAPPTISRPVLVVALRAMVGPAGTGPAGGFAGGGVGGAAR